jgi:hypothetical protein
MYYAMIRGNGQPLDSSVYRMGVEACKMFIEKEKKRKKDKFNPAPNRCFNKGIVNWL